MNKKYQAVLFDLDGTLLNTLQDLAEAVNRGLSFLGLPAHDLESFKYFVGEGREEMVTRALPESRREPATHPADGRFRQHLLRVALEGPYPALTLEYLNC